MRYSIAFAGLAATAVAGKVTITATEEVTITSCAPTHTECPYNGGDGAWGTWDPSASTTGDASSWGSWDPSKSTKTTTSSASWGSWDPSKPSASSSSSASWGSWDPSKPSASSTSTAWGSWDPSKPSASSSSSASWGSWDPSSPSASSTAWGSWDPSKASSTSTGAWGTWTGTASSSTPDAASCPVYTATAPPAWFSQLPTSVLSSLEAKWTGAPPSDWCYYSFTNGVVTSTKTPVASTTGTGSWGTWAATPDAASTGTAASASWSTWADPSATGVKGTSVGSGPIASYTGAANVNAASFVMAGAAAVAAVVLA